MSKDELKRYRVLCWGACLTGECQSTGDGDKCGIEYMGKRYEHGAVIEMPESVAKRHVEKGRLEETDLKHARGGVPVDDREPVEALVVEIEQEAEPAKDGD